MNEHTNRPVNYSSLAELGAELRSSREARKLTLDDISTMTCIRNHFLEGIETGDFSAFSSWVYARGFVRTYLSLMSRMDLWPSYDLFLSDNPPVYGQAMDHQDNEFEEDDQLTDQAGADEEDAEEIDVPEDEVGPVTDHPSSPAGTFQEPSDNLEDLEMGGLDEGDEPAAPVNEAFQVDRTVEKTTFDEEPDVRQAVQLDRKDFEKDASEDEEKQDGDQTLLPLVSESTLSQKKDQKDNGDNRSEPGTDSVPPRRRRGKAVTVRLPKEAPRPVQAEPMAPKQVEKNAVPPLLMSAMTRRQPGRYSSRRRSHGGLLLILLTLLIILGVGWFWWHRSDLAYEAQQQAKEQQESSIQTSLLTDPVSDDSTDGLLDEEDGAPTMAADIVHVSPEPEPSLAAPALVEVPEPAPSVHHELVVAAQGDCWLEVVQGDKKIYAKVIGRGARLTFPLEKGLRVTYGAAQNVTVTTGQEAPVSPGGGVVRLNYAPDGTATKR